MLGSILNKNTDEENDYYDFKSFRNATKINIEDLKDNILFKNWSDTTLQYFIDDDRILLKKTKYKELIANEIECENKIFILKTGEAKCFIKITRNQIKKHQKLLEDYSINPNFVDSRKFYFCHKVDKQKEKFLRENLLSAQSNDHLLKSKYLNHFEINKNLKLNKKENSFINLKQNSNLKPNLRQQKTKLNNIKEFSSTIHLIETKSSKKRITFDDMNHFRAASTNLVRMNRTINYLNDKPKSALPLTKKFDSKQNFYDLNDCKETNISDLFNSETEIESIQENSEISACNKIKLKNPEIWNQVYKPNSMNYLACFIKLLILKQGEIFGLSDYLFDDKREQEKLELPKTFLNLDVNKDESTKFNLITHSKYAECFIIDKEAYLKYMLSFTTDRAVINKYLDYMRQVCTKLPSNKIIIENFFQELTWKLYKKKTYNELLKSKPTHKFF